MSESFDASDFNQHKASGQPVSVADLPPTAAGSAGPGIFGSDGKLTRTGAEQVIADGGSVLYYAENGDPILATKPEHIPAVMLSLGGPDARQRELEHIARQRAELDAQELQLKATAMATKAKK